MNNRRKLIVALGAGALTAPFGSFAQQQGKVWRIGYLGPASSSGFASRVEALRAGLRELGYVEGKDISIDYRWADGKYDLLPELAADLLRLKVDVLVTHAGRATAAAKSKTTTIPIVMVSVSNPDTFGLITSLQQPSGNVTGLANFNMELAAKRLELIGEALPRAKRVAFLFFPENNSRQLKAAEIGAKSLKLTLQPFEARGPADFDGAFATMAKSRVDAVVVAQEAILFSNYKQIALLGSKYQLPSVGSNEFAEAGGMIGYQSSPTELYRRAAYFIDKIFKGAKPGELPVERPTKFELVVNMKTAKDLGIKIPNSILVQATKVIE